MQRHRIHGLKFANFGMLLVLFFFCSLCITPLIGADDPPLKPFHVQFREYKKNPIDGTYTFTLVFKDLPVPHIHWPDGRGEPWSVVKIGDMIGRYKILSFTQKVRPAGRLVEPGPTNIPELTLQNVTKPDDLVTIPYLEECNLPEAGLPVETK